MSSKTRFVAGKSEKEPKSLSGLIYEVYTDSRCNRHDALDSAIRFGSIEDVLHYQMSDN